MKALILALTMIFSAVMLADDYPANDSPKVGDKGRITGTVTKVVDNQTVQLQVNGKVFIVKADAEKQKDAFKDTVNNDNLTIAYVRIGTDAVNADKVAVVAFVKEYSKADLEKEAKDKEDKIKVEAQKTQQAKAATDKTAQQAAEKQKEEDRVKMLKSMYGKPK